MKPGCGIAAALLALFIMIDLLNGPPHFVIGIIIGIPLYALSAVIAFENPAAALSIAAGGLGIGLVLWRLCRRC